MHKQILSGLLLLSSLNPGLYAADKVDAGTYRFPEHVVINYKNQELNLSLTGLTMRKMLFMDIYSVAHYIDKLPASSVNELYRYILEPAHTKQISMVFQRELSAIQIKNSLLKSIKRNTDAQEFLAMQADVEKFMAAIYDNVKKNDEFTLRWFPDGTMVSLFEGDEISSINNEALARTMWSIWFGEKSVVDRKSLVTQMLTSS